MKHVRSIAVIATLTVLAVVLARPATAGAVAPGAAAAMLKAAGIEAASPVIKVRRGRPRVRRAGRRRPGAHRPSHRRHHARRKWRGKRWGRRVGGIIVGTAIAVAVAGSIPPRPAAGLCWAWSNPARTRGYWYDC